MLKFWDVAHEGVLCLNEVIKQQHFQVLQSSGAASCLVSSSIWSLIIGQTHSCRLSQSCLHVNPAGVLAAL